MRAIYRIASTGVGFCGRALERVLVFLAASVPSRGRMELGLFSFTTMLYLLLCSHYLANNSGSYGL